jgi:VWFA-related protein
MMWSRLLYRIAISIGAAATLPVGGVSQQAPQPPAPSQPVATLHVQAREVLLPVTVRDKHGALVTNLEKGDFTLTEDGRPQVIKSFTRQSNLPFQMGLLVDTSRSVSGAMDHERKAANKFVDQMLGGDAKQSGEPADAKPAAASAAQGDNEAFLIHFDREVELLQDFTASRDKLHREIDDMGPTSRSQDDRQGPETTGDGRERPRGHNGTQLYDAIFLAADELMKPKDGRKALLLFSDGVDRGSKETLNEAMDAAERASVTVYTIYFKGEQDHSYGGGFPGGGHHGGMGGGWPGGGYPGSGGGYPGRRGDEPSVDGKKIMEQIATRTGGRYFDTKKKEDLGEIYGLIADELQGQYLLTYTPDQVDKDGGYHKIVLKANNGDYTVTTRAGYFAPGGDSR